MRAIILVITCLVAPTVVAAQDAAASSATRVLLALRKAVTLAVPAEWHVLHEEDTDSVAQFVYHVRNPAQDSLSSDRTNVIVNVRKRPGSRTFRAFTDTVLGGLIEPTMLVLNDTSIDRSQRAVFWRGQIKATPYVGFDDFANIGQIWIHVRIALPLSEKASMKWSERFSDESRSLLASIRVNGRAAFPQPLGYPALTTFGPRGAARPNEALHLSKELW